jgi:hypothetical protein
MMPLGGHARRRRMPYTINRYTHDLLWVVMHGHLSREHAEAYFHDMWRLLDESPCSTDLLVDGRRIAEASHGARQRTEQIAHHPHLGHIAFVVSGHHLLLFAPFVKLVSGIGLFGEETEALDYLRVSRGQSGKIALPNLPPRPETLNGAAAHLPSQPAAPIPNRTRFERPHGSGATGFLNSLSSAIEGWARIPRDRDER